VSQAATEDKAQDAAQTRSDAVGPCGACWCGRPRTEAPRHDSARLDVELLLGRVLGIDRIGLIMQSERPLAPAD